MTHWEFIFFNLWLSEIQPIFFLVKDWVIHILTWEKEAIWIALVGLFVHVDIKYWDFLTLEGTFITPTFCVRVMKVPSDSLISPYFMFFFSFCHFLSRVHETLQKSDVSIFSNFHNLKPCQNLRLQFSPIFMTPHTWNLDSWFFSNFHDPGYMKPCKNQKFQFSLIFMNPGTWNLAKIRSFNFL